MTDSPSSSNASPSSSASPRIALCPVDFSEVSLHAAERAVHFAERLGVDALRLVHVFPLSAYADEHSPLLKKEKDVFAAQLDTLATRLRALTAPQSFRSKPLEIQTVLLHGSASKVLLEQVDATNAELVIMGTTGRSGLSHWVLGSVAETIVRTCPAPVLTVRLPAK